jgi:glucose-1-phosphate cytidylyltransferase
MKVVILCGGMGTRLMEETTVLPKPMVEIGGKPILWHIMNIYAHYGYNEFIIALGYKGDKIKEYFLNYRNLESDLTIDLKTGNTIISPKCNRDWIVHLVDTGLHTLTGGRIKRLAPLLKDETFMVTYGDGVANVDIDKLVKFHKTQGKIGTVTAVKPTARFGGIKFENDIVTDFEEKPQSGEGLINGGFFVFEPAILDMIADDKTILEREPLHNLVMNNQLAAFRHESFWQCMDTIREKQLLQNLWDSNEAHWKSWND